MKKKPCEPVVLEFWKYGEVEADINVKQIKPLPRRYYSSCHNAEAVPVEFSVTINNAKLSRVRTCGEREELAKAIRRRRAKAVLLDDPQRVVTDADAWVLARAIRSVVRFRDEYPIIRGATRDEKEEFKIRKK